MKATFKQDLEIQLDELTSNKLNLGMTVQGGSTPEFIPDDEESEPKNDEFIIRDFEKKLFVLGKETNFNKDIMTILQTSVVDITGVVVGCYNLLDGKTPSPIRFKVELQLSTMPSTVSMGYMSNLSLLNLLDSAIEKLVISDVQVEDLADGEFANLVIMVFSKNKNEPA